MNASHSKCVHFCSNQPLTQIVRSAQFDRLVCTANKLRQNVAGTHAESILGIDAAQFFLFNHIQKIDAIPANKPMLLLDFVN